MKLGIGITTRNRPKVLDICLQHFINFTNLEDVTLCIVDDESDLKFSSEYREVVNKYPGVVYYRNPRRLGIAKSKNECIKRIRQCDYIFMFDDDTFPRQVGWEDKFISVTEKYPQLQHLMYLSDVFTKINTEKTDGAKIEIINQYDLFAEYGNCFGICLYFTKNAIELLGGYYPKFGIYGYEHAELSKRAEWAGLTGGLKNYIGPNNINEYIYSFDTDYYYLKELPPLVEKLGFEFDTSLDRKKESVQGYISNNLKVWHTSNKLCYKI
jgi:glycosyltransferase involved in cell wall biosynthesis